jgi:hypothetical protein
MVVVIDALIAKDKIPSNVLAMPTELYLATTNEEELGQQTHGAQR